MGQTISERTSAEVASELEAYNRAFDELELPWHWDAKTYRELLDAAGERDCVSVYIERKQPHLLRAYDKRFLSELVLGVRERCRRDTHHA
ncbi:MAG TPA: hypothetical protein VEN29_19030 [Casimicrobiaceae bacterium]|nr:hypothetical protein [Casimicrobiaceae bacterium]